MMISVTHFTLVLLVTLAHYQYQAFADIDFEGYIPDEKLFDCFLGWTLGHAPNDADVQAWLVVPNGVEHDGPFENLENIVFSDDLALMTSKHLKPDLPFKFFMNGFNINGPISVTWMYKVAQNLVEHQQYSRHNLTNYNYVIIYWQIRGLATDQLVSSLVFYHRTMTKYKQVVAKAATMIDRMIDYREAYFMDQDIEKLRSYFNRFQFYGHSLGAHIAFHTAYVLQKRRPNIKFGKIVGLDPPLLCFTPGVHGINGRAGKEFAHDIVVVHSASGIVGIQASPGTTEIVLNGGTFQPKCPIDDLSCHHGRSWGILNYYDDQCQMVAYTCRDMEQFRSGSCFHGETKLRESEKRFRLVNLAEQHFNKPFDAQPSNPILVEGDEIISYLYRALDRLAESYWNRTLELRAGEPMNNFYYVRTARARNHEGNSHCLQHYQARLVILNKNSKLDDECAIKNFNRETMDGLKLRMFYTVSSESCSTKCQVDRSYRADMDKVFGELIPGKLFTSLITFQNEPTIFTDAYIYNIDLVAWAECLSNKKVVGNFTFILDISFMSNIDPVIRKVHSSVLCETWTPGSDKERLEFTLCNKTMLENAGGGQDPFKVEGTEQPQDPWYIRLLNSLSLSIFNWAPLIQ